MCKNCVEVISGFMHTIINLEESADLLHEVCDIGDVDKKIICAKLEKQIDELWNIFGLCSGECTNIKESLTGKS
jgi:hypothetical protein